MRTCVLAVVLCMAGCGDSRAPSFDASDVCESRCEEAVGDCLGTTTDCVDECSTADEEYEMARGNAVDAGCGPEYDAMIDCVIDTPACATSDELDAACGDELDELSACLPAAGCAFDSDCPAREICDAAVCVDASPLYESCVDSADCTQGQCFEVTTTGGTNGAFCSLACDDDTDCPLNGELDAACYDPGGALVCFQRCFTDDDCDLGSFCSEVQRTDGLLDYICVPD